MITLFLIIHLIAAAFLAAYGGHRLYLARLIRARVIGSPSPPRHCGPQPGARRLPSVTVQLPLFNERYVATRALKAAAALDYPRSLLEIQVLDDSTDETCRLVRTQVDELCARGMNVTHIRRGTRAGYKAGALAHGLELATGELIAVFDADFVPQTDFLKRLVGEFADPAVGMVQARWGHLNANHSLLTRVQALQLDAHFTIEHGARAAMGCFFNFNGTAGIWRKRAIEHAGGWCADTLTEDLDLSYRAQLAGWRFVYRDDVVVPAELPVEIAAYRIQQQRWAQGSTQTATKLLPAIAHAPLGLRVKCEAVWHLTGHLAYVFLIVLAFAGTAAGLMTGSGYRSWLMFADAALIGVATLSLAAFYSIAARLRRSAHWWRDAVLVVPIMILGAGIACEQALAVVRGAVGSPTPFRRTPKYRNEGNGDVAWRSAVYRISRLRPAVGEGLLGCAILSLFAVSALFDFGYPSGPVLLIGVGFVSTGLVTLVQHPRFYHAGASLSAPTTRAGTNPTGLSNPHRSCDALRV